jgi:hypothetical protein
MLHQVGSSLEPIPGQLNIAHSIILAISRPKGNYSKAVLQSVSLPAPLAAAVRRFAVKNGFHGSGWAALARVDYTANAHG